MPPYSGAQPVECSVRCVCGLHYLVFISEVDIGGNESRARERAVKMRATFIDAQDFLYELRVCIGRRLMHNMSMEFYYCGEKL
jgi:hypothetical protein